MTPETPTTEVELVELIRSAREPLLVCGAGTRLPMLRPVRADLRVTTTAMRGITLHAPKELVFSARAGTPLADVEAHLAADNQMLIAEPPDLSALFGGGTNPTLSGPTLGGLVATNLSGPRRIAEGAVRDHLLGVRAVNGAGELIRSGGRVLKNVTGLDVAKLLAGSHGTLAVLSEVTLKVLPRPEATATLALSGLDPAAGVAALAAALGSPYGVSGAAYLPDGDVGLGVPGPATLIRIENFEASVRHRIAGLLAQLAGQGAPTVLDDAASRALWRKIRDAIPLEPAPMDAVWRVSVRPSRGPNVLAATGLRGFLDWGGGLVWLAGPATEPTHATVRAAAQAAGGTWMLLRGPEHLNAAVDVVPPESPALAAITRRVKAAFDPSGILNPGRIYADL